MHSHPNELVGLVHLRTDEARRAADRHRQAGTTAPTPPRPGAPAPRQRRRGRMASRRRRAGRGLLALAAAAAAAASASALAALGAEPASSELLAVWRGFGLIVFAGLFALVAAAPERYPGVLELAILHKAALTAWAVGSQAPDAALVMVADGALTLVLLVAYLLLSSHRAWRTAHAEQV